mgnify:CR=1 FL=1
MSATPIEISVGGSRTATEWDGCSITWADFTDDLQNAMQNNCGTETHAEYMALSKGKQADLKDVGGFVGGTLRGGSRKRGCCTGRSLITLDMDNCEPGSTAKWCRSSGHGHGSVYSTRKHDPEHPRLRAIFPTDRGIQPEEYQPAPGLLAQMLDPTIRSFDPNHLSRPEPLIVLAQPQRRQPVGLRGHRGRQPQSAWTTCCGSTPTGTTCANGPPAR